MIFNYEKMAFLDEIPFKLEEFKYQILLCFGVLALTLYTLWSRREKNLPPGPIGLPLVGYLPFLGSEAYITLHKLTQKYGPIYSLYLGRKLVVVLGKFDVVKEALLNNNILDRPKNPPNHLLPNSTNLSMSNGKTWKEQRQFSVQLLHKLGMAKQEMEDQIQSEIQKLIAEIDKKDGKGVNLDSLLYSSVSNNILSLLIGHSMDYADKDRQFLNTMLKTTTLYSRPTRIHAYYPWLRKWMIRLKVWGYDRTNFLMHKLGKFIENQIENHKKTLDKHVTRDYIDGYLQAMTTAKGVDSSFSERMLKGNFQSLFSAGSTPSRAALEWSLLSVIQDTGVQKAVQYELDTVVGRNRQVTWGDHLKLPYTMAVIFEAMRQNAIVPISMLRCTTTRVKLAGYDLPKDTLVMTNMWGILHDPECFEDPFSFKPERFIRDGKSYRPSEFIPFSYGKRNCPGEDMGLMILFLYFASLLQRYSLSFPTKDYNFKHVLGVARLVILDNIQLTLRN